MRVHYGEQNAQQQGVEKALLEFFDLDSAGFNNLPLFLSNISSKLESIANSYFNTNITRQLISGWHAAQLSDFGFQYNKQEYHQFLQSFYIEVYYQFDGVVNLKD